MPATFAVGPKARLNRGRVLFHLFVLLRIILIYVVGDDKW